MDVTHVSLSDLDNLFLIELQSQRLSYYTPITRPAVPGTRSSSDL